MLLSAAATETQKVDEPIWVLVRSRPYFVRVRRRDITVSEDSAVVQLQAPGIAFSEADVVPGDRAATRLGDTEAVVPAARRQSLHRRSAQRHVAQRRV